MFGESDSTDKRGAVRRRVAETLRSMTRVLQYVGFGSRPAPSVPREQESTREVEVAEQHELHEQLHGQDVTRLDKR